MELYHVSRSDNLHLLTPSVPRDALKPKAWENGKIKRICLAPSIRGCLLGLSIKESDFIGVPHILLYVYSPIDEDVVCAYPNKRLIDEKLVFDANITGEVWITKEVKIKKMYQIKVLNFKNTPEKIEYDPVFIADSKLLNPHGRLTAYLPQFKIIRTY